MATKKKDQTGPQLPANLSFLRSLEPTSGVMHAVQFEGAASLADIYEGAKAAKLTPVLVTSTTVRGTISNDHKDAAEKRVGTGEKSLNAANIATIEQALLPVDASHLVVTNTIRFSGHAATPAMCSSPSFSNALKQLVAEYANKGGFKELANRYVLNIANGSWLWRNRFGQDLQVRISVDGEAVYMNEADIDMSKGFDMGAVLNAEKRAQLERIAGRVAEALSGGKPAALDVAGMVEMGAGAEVFPSQEFSSKETEKVVKGREAEKVAKTLSKQNMVDGTWVATIHARKIGNAIRTIDTWHGNDDIGAIAVEVYGANTHQGEAHRINQNDLYSYLRNPEQLLEQMQDGVSGVHHYVVACLVRGGVYGFHDASKGAKASAAETATEDTGQE